ncbi:ParB/RepB/Spo0J family partition protein [Amycolatopsis arida]|nr:helix-turn-helix domain-containing protein [Amycolatopsis arida]
MLAECGSSLPPIIVHRRSMRVVDGMHRLRAAILRGDSEIDVRLYDGDEGDAFVLAVQANVTHGLPLSAADRRQAAERILRTHPDWSDRMIATAAGLSPATVRKVRMRTTADDASRGGRLGKDGRVRPLNGAAGRELAGRLIAERPGATLREIAKEVGISLSTARDVRERVRRGLDPVPARGRAGRSAREEIRARPVPDLPSRRSAAQCQPSRADRLSLLREDPSIRFNDMGRLLLRWLEVDLTTAEWRRSVADSVPAHCVDGVLAMAWENVRAWQDLAERLDQRGRIAAERTTS